MKSYFILCYLLLSLFILVTLNSGDRSTFALPILKISPECGSLSDHRLNISVNGFSRDGNVHWKFINSNGLTDTFGYFETNKTGGFSDHIIVEEMIPDNYTINVFDDKNNDYQIDYKGLELKLKYIIPCI